MTLTGINWRHQHLKLIYFMPLTTWMLEWANYLYASHFGQLRSCNLTSILSGHMATSGNENASWRPLHQKPQPEVDLSSFSMFWVDNVILFPTQFSWHEQAWRHQSLKILSFMPLTTWMLEWANYGGGVWSLFGIGAVRDNLTASLIKTIYLNRQSARAERIQLYLIKRLDTRRGI